MKFRKRTRAELDLVRADRIIARFKTEGWFLVAQKIASLYHLPLREALSRSRSTKIALAKQHIFAVLRWSTEASYPELSMMLELDHNTIITAERNHGARLEAAFGQRGPWTKLVEKRRSQKKLAYMTDTRRLERLREKRRLERRLLNLDMDEDAAE